MKTAFKLIAFVLLLILAIPVFAQNGVYRNEITDPTARNIRMQPYVGTWTLAEVSPPKAPEHKGVPGWYNTTIFKINFAIEGNSLTATLLAYRTGIGSDKPETKVYEHPIVYKLESINEVVQDGVTREEMMFSHTFTHESVEYIEFFVLFMAPGNSNKIVGVDFDSIPTGSREGGPAVDGLWFGVKGDNLEAFETTAQSVSYDSSMETPGVAAFNPIKKWAGFPGY